MTDPRTVGRIEVDKGLCIGSASCVAIAPDVFELGEDGKSRVKRGASLADTEKIIEAARQCPVRAIKVFDRSGRPLYP